MLLLCLQGNTPHHKPFMKEVRLALLIVNAEYKYQAKLTNPINDVLDMAQALRNCSFDINLKQNVNLVELMNSVSDFATKTNELVASGYHVTALVYYVGHALQYNNTNYLLTKEFNVEECEGLKSNAYSLNDLQQKISNAHVKFFLIDACSTNFKCTQNTEKYPKIGLAPFSAENRNRYIMKSLPQGAIISFAAEPNQTIKESKVGENNPYITSLLKFFRRNSNMEANAFFDNLVNDVWESTDGEQIPWRSGSLKGGKFYFKKNPTPDETDSWEGLWKCTTKCGGVVFPHTIIFEKSIDNIIKGRYTDGSVKGILTGKILDGGKRIEGTWRGETTNNVGKFEFYLDYANPKSFKGRYTRQDLLPYSWCEWNGDKQ